MLGWSPEQALNTPIPQLELALEGRTEWQRRISGIPDTPQEPPAPKNDVAARLKAALGALAARKR